MKSGVASSPSLFNDSFFFSYPVSNHSRYPYVATEVLCSEIWSIVETCVNEQHQVLEPFWETVLDRPAEDMKTQMVMAAHFAKINSVFLSKKPQEVRFLCYSAAEVRKCFFSSDAGIYQITTFCRRMLLAAYRDAAVCGPVDSDNSVGRASRGRWHP